MEYDPIREGELLRVMAIEQHMIMLIGKGGHHYRAPHVQGVRSQNRIVDRETGTALLGGDSPL